MKRKLRIRVIYLIVLILIMLSWCGLADGDTKKNVGIENGFEITPADESSIFYCAYKGDGTEFDLDNVALNFYYGGYYYQGVEYELENIHNFPFFELHFTDDYGGDFLVRRVEENFVSQKYSCNLIRDANWNTIEVKFNHSETITIPAGIFTNDYGRIYFSIYGTNIRETDAQIKCIAGICIFYKIANGNVILSNQQFE